MSELMLLNERPKRFRIIARLSVLSPKQQLENDSLSDEPSSNELLPWCLIFEDSAAGATSSRSPVRWIEESQAQQWRKEGSVVAGTIPQPLQETWEHSLSSLRSELDQQREDLTSRLDEVNAAYQAYKLRAQSALKRIGNEERNEKQRAHEQEVRRQNIEPASHVIVLYASCPRKWSGSRRPLRVWIPKCYRCERNALRHKKRCEVATARRPRS